MCLGHDPFEILQIIQAGGGWRAVFEEDGQLKQVPVACFALVKHKKDNFTFVGAMNPLLDDPSVIMPSEENDANFLGYLGPGESIEKFNVKGDAGNVSEN